MMDSSTKRKIEEIITGKRPNDWGTIDYEKAKKQIKKCLERNQEK